MFGQNPVRKQDLREDAKLDIQESFATIQGEGPYAGMPSVFVRLWGCNLRCRFCDTDFESNRETFSDEALWARIMQLKRDEAPKVSLLVITGGEPLRQNILPLVARATTLGWTVQIETAGTLWIDGLEDYIGSGLDIVCSPKTPHIHPMVERFCSHYKYIIASADPSSKNDGLPMANTQPVAVQREHGGALMQPLYRPLGINEPHPPHIWVQPCDEGSEVLNTRNYERCVALALKHGYRISIQQHKVLNVR